MPNKTKFDRLVEAAAEVLAQIRRMEDRPRLTAKAFFAEALKEGECTAADVAKLEKALADAPAADHAKRFIRELSRALSGPEYPRPVPRARMARALRAYGRPEAEGEIGALGATVGVACALAAKIVGDANPSVGTIADMDKHVADVAAARARLHRMLDRLKIGYAPIDLEDRTATLAPSERQRGLSKLVFKRCPDVSPATPGWPRRLVEECLGVPRPVVAPGTVPEEGIGEEAARRRGVRIISREAAP